MRCTSNILAAAYKHLNSHSGSCYYLNLFSTNQIYVGQFESRTKFLTYFTCEKFHMWNISHVNFSNGLNISKRTSNCNLTRLHCPHYTCMDGTYVCVCQFVHPSVCVSVRLVSDHNLKKWLKSAMEACSLRLPRY